MKTIIRQGTIKDLKDIAQLEVELTKYIIKNYEPDVKLAFAKKHFIKAHNRYKKNFKKYLFIVAKENNELVGCITSGLSRDKLINANVLWVYDTFVKEHYRRNQIGKKMFGELFKLAKKRSIKHINVCSHSDNKKAIKFWKTLGFKECARDYRLKI